MSEKVKKVNVTRAQAAKALHEKKSKERAKEQQSLKGLYLAEKDNPVVQDIIFKAQRFQDYHRKIAQDGVGARKTGYKLEDGSDEVENYNLSDSEIAGEMKKAAGLQELVDYINRQTTPDADLKAQMKK